MQKRLAEYNDTQCGYCSPKMDMLIHRFLGRSHSEIGASWEQQICRCTGYRPILNSRRILLHVSGRASIVSTKPNNVRNRGDSDLQKSGASSEETC